MYSIVAILFAIRIYSNPVHCSLKYIPCVVLKVKVSLLQICCLIL